MGNHTRNCSIIGCVRKVYGRGFCIGHFSNGVENLRAAPVATDTCIPWEGRPERFQEAAKNSLISDGHKMPRWAWVVVTCGSATCLNTDHLDLKEPQKLVYPHGVCIYCGRTGNTKDHILPRGWTGESQRKFVATVPACRTCNSVISDTLTTSVNLRRAVCHRRLARKYRRLLSMPKWDDQELAGISGMLREYILDEMSKRAEVRKMLEWPEDAAYDIRAMERSGIEDPYEVGLLETQNEKFEDTADDLAGM